MVVWGFFGEDWLSGWAFVGRLLTLSVGGFVARGVLEWLFLCWLWFLGSFFFLGLVVCFGGDRGVVFWSVFGLAVGSLLWVIVWSRVVFGGWLWVVGWFMLGVLLRRRLVVVFFSVHLGEVSVCCVMWWVLGFALGRFMWLAIVLSFCFSGFWCFGSYRV